MTHRVLGGAKGINVILSEAKNLVHIRGVARMPRSFATLRTTTVGRSVRKSTVPYKESVDMLAGRASRRPLEGRGLLSPSGLVFESEGKSSVRPEEPPPSGGVSKGAS